MTFKSMAEVNEEVTSEKDEVVEDNDTEVVEELEADNDSPTLEDYSKLLEKNKQLYERATKAETKAKVKRAEVTPSNKPNETQSTLSRDEAILFAKGHTDEEVALALKLAQVNDVSVTEAIKDEIFTGKVSNRLKKEKSAKASLRTSGPVGFNTDKPMGEMTTEEHAEVFHKALGNK